MFYNFHKKKIKMEEEKTSWPAQTLKIEKRKK